MKTDKKQMQAPGTKLPEELYGAIIELTPAAITIMLSNTNPNRVGMLVLSDELKRAHNSVMPKDERGKRLLARLPQNTVVALKRVDSVDMRWRFV